MSATPPPPYRFTLLVYNSAGELVDQADGQDGYHAPTGLQAQSGAFVPDQGQKAEVTVQGAGNILTWDGRNSAGQIVDGGSYRLVLSTTDPFGHTTVFSVQETVLRQAGTLSVDVYNSAGEVVRSWQVTPTSGHPGSGLRLSSTRLVEGGGRSLSIGFDGQASDSLTWDGSDGQGAMVASGTYLVEVSSQSGQVLYGGEVTVVRLPGRPFASVRVAPNPVPAGQAGVEIFLPENAPGAPVRGSVYDMAGERVAGFDGRGTLLVWNFQGREPADGVYFIQLKSQVQGQDAQTTVVKVAILR